VIALVDKTWVAIYVVVWLASLIPVVWAIVDVTRRPPWQFSGVRKVMWALTLGLGWFFLWPLALVSAVWYLSVLRRRFPPTAAQPRNPIVGHRYGWPGSYGPYGGGAYPPQGPYDQQPQGPQGPQDTYGGAADPYGYRPPPAHLPPAGWYTDPAGTPQERWWDGRGWTDHLRPRPAGDQGQPGSASQGS
jgi:Protein of unknown function (DUF2510)